MDGRAAYGGDALFRMRVVRSADGGPVRVWPAIMRWLVLGLPGVVVGVAYRTLPDDATVVAGLMAIFVAWIWPLILLASVARSPSRAGLHDRLAATAVVVADT